MLVYDITNRVSFDNIMTWKNEFFTKAEPKDANNVPIYVIGNKSDLEHERVVEKEKLEKFKSDHPEMVFYETSAI